VGRGGVADALMHAVPDMAGAGIEEMPEAGGIAQDRAGPGGPVVPGGRGGGGKTGAKIGPVREVGADGVTLGDVAVAQFGIAEALVGLEEIDVPVGAIAEQPEIPDPLIGNSKRHSRTSFYRDSAL